MAKVFNLCLRLRFIVCLNFVLSEDKTVANYSVLVLHDVITTYNAVLSYTEITASQPLSLCMVCTNTG